MECVGDGGIPGPPAFDMSTRCGAIPDVDIPPLGGARGIFPGGAGICPEPDSSMGVAVPVGGVLMPGGIGGVAPKGPVCERDDLGVPLFEPPGERDS